jgi:hypothetical protein
LTKLREERSNKQKLTHKDKLDAGGHLEVRWIRCADFGASYGYHVQRLKSRIVSYQTFTTHFKF